jgi:phosphatidylserine/phosphatidylglycerophosphate/cardiolipin synthase-like enzyme
LFLLIGAAIYGAYALFGERPQEEQDRTIVITEDHVNSLATSFARRWNRSPTNKELLNLVRDYLRQPSCTARRWPWAWTGTTTSSAAGWRRSWSF